MAHNVTETVSGTFSPSGSASLLSSSVSGSQQPPHGVNLSQATTPISYTFESVNFNPGPDASSSSATPARRPVGRPKGSGLKKKVVPSEPKRRPGRPRGSGKKQIEVAEGEKRGPGRPRKENDVGFGEVMVKFGKFVVPGSGVYREGGPAPSQDRPSPYSLLNGPRPVLANPNTQPFPNENPTTAPAAPLPNITSPVGYDTQCTSNEGPVVALQPGEDPAQVVDCEEGPEGEGEEGDDANDLELHRNEDDASGEGVGANEDDLEGGDDDEEEDDIPGEDSLTEPGSTTGNPPSLPSAATSTAPRRTARPLAPWLAKAFREHLALANQRINGIPRLYCVDQTFWFPQKSNYFLLQSSGVTPTTLYNPRFFLWDPMALVDSIACPQCHTQLIRHGSIPRPRRCVDGDSPFWIIGYRYLCTTCRNPTSNRTTVTFQSWDARILERLPPHLRDEFPARLSWRNGMSVDLFEWMRCCFQSGMGAKQFSDCVRVKHFLQHDKRHLQYLHALSQRKLDTFAKLTYIDFPPYADTSPLGAHGFVPTGSWFRNMYDAFIKEHRHEFHQHIAMLPLNVGALDHSHKFPKHIIRVGKQKLFGGLLSVTNEVGEICSCHLVTTTGHSQSGLALGGTSNSLKLFGHPQPSVIYTDNVLGDKNFLEGLFDSSLKQDVVPIEEYSYLEEFSLPDEVSVALKNTPTAINNACRLILDDLGEDGSSKVVVGFDTEWNVEFEANGRIQRRGATSVIQIAHRRTVYVFQVGKEIADGKLPVQLKVLLENPNVIKVGRQIQGDLKNLETASHSRMPFSGAVDLAAMAKQRCVLTNIRTTTLADLCARVLHKRLNKNVSERLSNTWDTPELSDGHLRYAALDAYASLCIYNTLQTLREPRRIQNEDTPEIGTPVMIYNGNRSSFIASGVLAAGEQRQNAGSAERAQRGSAMVVQVTDVIQGSAVIKSNGMQPYSLESLGTPPFSLLYPKSHLIVYDPLPPPPTPPPDSLYIENRPRLRPTAPISPAEEAWLDSVIQSTACQYEIDPASASAGERILQREPRTGHQPVIHSRVLNDAWHGMHTLNIPQRHALRDDFMRSLSDAWYILDYQDASRAAVWAASQNPPMTLDELRRFYASFLSKRCKRYLPDPLIMHARSFKVMKAYGPLKDASTGLPLFDEARWKAAQTLLDRIAAGHFSDPPGIPLYSMVGLDKKTGLPLYRCFRGTNITEGGVHTHLLPHLPSSGASIEHVEACLLDFTLRHNLIVGTKNTTGRAYQGHFSVWLTNEIDELRIYLKDILLPPPGGAPAPPHINGNLYRQTSEVPVGVLPIPDDVREANGLAKYEEEVTPKLRKQQQKRPFDYLAQLQGTQKPILPVHSPAERTLFHHLMEDDPNFCTNNGNPNWNHAVKAWNAQADVRDGIFYKLSEHLQSYFNTWKTNTNIKASLSLTASVREPVKRTMRNLELTVNAPPVPHSYPHPHVVTSGGLWEHNSPSQSAVTFSHPQPRWPSLMMPAPPPNPANTPTTNTPTLSMSSTMVPPAPAPLPISNPTSHPTWNMEEFVNHRVQRRYKAREAHKKARSPRHCMKCGQTSCDGRNVRTNCKDPCQDCGSYACKGRNSARPTKKCHEAWY